MVIERSRCSMTRSSPRDRRMLNQTAAAPSTSHGLIRILGIGFGLAVIVGSTIGIGILRTPGLVAGQLPNRGAILTVWVAGGLYTLVGAAIALAPPLPAAAALASQTPSFAGLIVALQSVVITYGGWQSGLYFSEEDRDPNHNLPRSMIGGVAAVVAVYLLVNVALLAVLPIADLARSTLPAADAAQRIVGGRGREVITILSILSLPPMLNAILMIGTRILFAMGRDRLVWRRAAAVSARGTPSAAMLATTVVALALVATGTF